MREAVWRPIIVWAGLAVGVPAAVVLLFNISNLIDLVCVFLVVVGAGHVAYAGLLEHIRQVHVRAIDYIYVGLGAAALFIGLQGELKRTEALRLLANAEADSAGIPRTVDTLMQYSISSRHLSCDGVISYGLTPEVESSLHAPFCSWIPSVVAFFKSAPTPMQLKQFVDDGTRTLTAHLWDEPALCEPATPVSANLASSGSPPGTNSLLNYRALSPGTGSLLNSRTKAPRWS